MEVEDPGRTEPPRTEFTERLRLSLMGGENGSRRVLAADDPGDETRLQRFHLSGNKNDGASLLQPEGVFGGHGQRRDVVQRGLDRKQTFRTCPTLHQFGEFFQPDRVFGRK